MPQHVPELGQHGEAVPVGVLDADAVEGDVGVARRALSEQDAVVAFVEVPPAVAGRIDGEVVDRDVLVAGQPQHRLDRLDAGRAAHPTGIDALAQGGAVPVDGEAVDAVEHQRARRVRHRVAGVGGQVDHGIVGQSFEPRVECARHVRRAVVGDGTGHGEVTGLGRGRRRGTRSCAGCAVGWVEGPKLSASPAVVTSS